MSLKLYFIRKTKALFVRLHLHVFFAPFSGFFLNLVYLTKISQWNAANKHRFKQNDFYASKWNYDKRYKVYEFLVINQQLTEPINYMEFGVCEGHSFKWWVNANQHTESTFSGFDTFEGLPEDWGDFKAGDMSVNANFPKIDDSRATFHKGLFQDTLPGFINNGFDRRKKVIHLDADLYSSTLYVLTSLANHLNDGDVILFDEFNVPQHEFLAYLNFTQSYYINLEPLIAMNNYFFVAFRVKK